MMSLLSDFGVAVSVMIHTDASAAIRIVCKAGLGKPQHLNVRYLWVQDQVHQLLGLERWPARTTPADVATKHISAEVMKNHLERLGVRTGAGRAGSAPVLGSLSKC